MKHIRNAQKSIKIVTGEISAYNYFELRNEAEEAAKRGVKIDVYASGPNIDIINRLIRHNIDVYVGNKDSSEHFMICDSKDVIVSQKDVNRVKPTPMGIRRGLIIDDVKEVKRYILKFKKLKEDARKEKIRGPDPLLEALNNPIK